MTHDRLRHPVALPDPAAFLRRAAARSPVEPGADADLDAALARAGWAVDSRTLRAATVTLGGCLAAVALPFLVLAPLAGVLLVLGGTAALAALHAVPRLRSTADRARADGDGPAFVCRAALGVALHGTPEAAVEHATSGPLGRELAAHVATTHGDRAAGWTAFRETLTERAPAFARALALVDAATEAPPDERDRLLDAATATARRATRERFGDYAASLHGPVSGVYAFGVVLPLALVGVLPVLPSAGAAIPPSALALAYDAALPLGLAAAGAWLLANRPVAVPAPAVPANHADLLDSHLYAPLTGLLAGLAGFAACSFLAPAAGPVVAVGLGVGAALLTYSRSREAVRERYESILDGIPAATTAAATRLVADDPSEHALDAAGRISDETGRLFADAAARRRALSLPPRESVAGPYGALDAGALPAVERTVGLVVAAADAGPRGGRVLRDYADTRRDLAGLAADLRAELGHTTGTLRTTGRFFAPGIAGVTVALAGRVHALGKPGASHHAFPTTALALVVGAYVLWLAALLPVLAAGLEGPLDRTSVAGEAGRGLLAAACVFPVVLLAARRLV